MAEIKLHHRIINNKFNDLQLQPILPSICQKVAKNRKIGYNDTIHSDLNLKGIFLGVSLISNLYRNFSVIDFAFWNT